MIRGEYGLPVIGQSEKKKAAIDELERKNFGTVESTRTPRGESTLGNRPSLKLAVRRTFPLGGPGNPQGEYDMARVFSTHFRRWYAVFGLRSKFA